MQQYEYKYGFAKIKVGISKEMITYKNKSLPIEKITGAAIGYIPIGRMVAGGAVGGIVGHAIASKGMGNALDKSIKPKDMPAKQGHLTFAYQENPQSKIKALRIPVNIKDEICLKMLDQAISITGNKYKGVGHINAVPKALGISQKGIIIGVLVFILVIVGIIVFLAIPQ